VLPKAFFGTLQSSGNLAGGGTPYVGYDNRFPLTGTDWAFNTQASLSHTRGSHTFKFGVMREDEYFGQARASIFGGQFNFDNESTTLGYRMRMRTRCLPDAGIFRSLGRPDDRRQSRGRVPARHLEGDAQITLDIGLRM
jgi:hypothetical protein